MSTHIKNKSVYRIYTEDKNRDATVRLVAFYFANFTIIGGNCYWHGKEEATVIFEIIDDGQDKDIACTIEHMAQAIRQANEQSDVLVTEGIVNISFID